MSRELILDEPDEPRPRKSGTVYDVDTYRDLRAGLKINRTKLDEEVIAQPNDFFHASEGATLASARRDKAKYDLEVTVAELDKDVRDAMIAGGEKVTETQVKAQIIREHDYHTAHQKLLEADLAVSKWEALKNAYRQRADMLKLLVNLHQIGWYGENVGASERRDALDRADERRRPRSG